jgi:GT2 family glycosyltransferase
VQNQVYGNWEICLADDGSGDPELRKLLKEWSAQDSRIKVTELSSNRGISAASNEAISLATGEFVGFLDHDDELVPNALYQVVKLLQEHHEADLIYSDEDKLDFTGGRCDPFFKPDWSPDLLLSNNYICHFLVVRRQLLNEVGGLRPDYDGSQDYDLVLRLIERTKQIHHIPHILYHWRAVEASTAFSSGAKPKAHVAAESAIGDYLRRNKIPARVDEGCAPGQWLVRYEILESPKVAMILPTGGKLELLRPCLESIFSTTAYTHYEILLVDNSKGPHIEQYLRSIANHPDKLRYLDYRGKTFNYSALNNFAVGKTEAPLLLFLNDDTTVVNADWLTAMVEHGQRPGVGAVGAKLLYPWGTIQHAGVVMGIYECTSHAFKNIPDKIPYYFHFPQIVRNCSAVTAACMLTKKLAFLEMGGFDEKYLAVAFQDVDYCLKLCKAGYYIVYTPAAVLVHHESVTKEEKIPNLKEVRHLQRKWREVITRDPFYSPNLTRKAEDYTLRLD